MKAPTLTVPVDRSALAAFVAAHVCKRAAAREREAALDPAEGAAQLLNDARRQQRDDA